MNSGDPHSGSLPLFGEEPNADEVRALVKRYPLGCWFRQVRRKVVTPYWVARTPYALGSKDRYVGDEATKRRIERAWEIVRAELARAAEEAAPAVRDLEAAAERVPSIRKLLELQAIAGLRRTRVLDGEDARVLGGGENRAPQNSKRRSGWPRCGASNL